MALLDRTMREVQLDRGNAITSWRGFMKQEVLACRDTDEWRAGRLAVLLILICNAGSISLEGKDQGDPRYTTLVAIGHELRRRGHIVFIGAAGAFALPHYRTRQNINLRKAYALREFAWLSRHGVERCGKPNVSLHWVDYVHHLRQPQHRRRYKRPSLSESMEHPLAIDILKDVNRPHLVYENGMTKGAVTLDPQGLLGDSFFVESLNKRLQEQFDNASCSSYIRDYLHHGWSKRPQLAAVDIPQRALGHYVFIPTQKFHDVSLMRYSSHTYPELLWNATQFCKKHNFPMVVKIHPHLVGREREQQAQLISVLRMAHPDVMESKASINFLTHHARFTVTLNG